MKVIPIYILTFCLAGVNCFSQSIDSLKNLLSENVSSAQRPYLLKDLSYEFLNQQELDSTLKYARLGVEAAVSIGDKRGEAYNLEMLGNYYYYNALYEKAMSVISNTLHIGEQLHDIDLLARAFGMMGWIYLEQRRFEGALDAFAKSLHILKKGRGDSEDLALAYFGIAGVYSYRHSAFQNLALAESFYDSALLVKPGLKLRERAFALAELGAAYRDHDRAYGKALQYLHRADTLIASEINHIDAQAYVLAELALTYSMNQDISRARAYANKVVSIYEHLPISVQIPSVFEMLSETFERLNDFKMAFRMENLNRALSDSLFSRRNILLVEQIHAQYNDQQRVREIKQLSETNLLTSVQAKNSRKIAILVSVSSLIIIVLLVLIYFNRTRFQKKLQRLELQHSIREERDRIARDLHDSLGGQLSSISIGLSRVGERMDSELIRDVQTMADRALHELRDSLWVMNTDVISIESIEQRVNTLFWQYRKIESPLQFDIKVNETLNALTIPSVQGGNLYRIIQEATHNAVKHSKAAQLQVLIDKDEHFLSVEIKDNGAGFLVDANLMPEHFGLRNMKKRADDMGAEIKFHTKVGEGTRIEVILPVLSS